MKMAQDFEQKIKTALQEECGSILVSNQMKQKIDEEIYQNQEEKRMKHFNMRRVVIGVAVACLFLTGAGYAVGKTEGFKSSLDFTKYRKYDSFEKIAEAEEKLGYEVDCVEQFSNGYTFVGAEKQGVDAMDENGKTTYTFEQLVIEYQKADEPEISLYIEKPIETFEDTKTPDAVRECEGITVEYDLYTYKCVPTDYELTEEDMANENRDDYFISVGSDEVEISMLSSVTWEKEGISYNLLGFDLTITPEEMLAMAEEIILAE